ncbi:MAG: sensor histidine kinase [Clostridia bacterium]|nr:sensor histidine kinase [Clostridia bacterium]
MNDILQLNVLAVYFLYGLSFYTMGVAVALQYRSYSSFRLANSLSLLAAFALLHGVSEWGSVFIPVRLPDFGAFPTWKLLAIQRLLQSISYFFLFCFGVKLISDSRKQNFYWWFILPTMAFLFWFLHFSRFIPLVGTDEVLSWLLDSESWSRYALAFPAGLFTAYGLALQVSEVEKLEDGLVRKNLWLATVAFGLFALLSGMVVPRDIGLLSPWVNTGTFLSITGMPIEIMRTVTALLATWSITRMLTIFDLEKQRQVAESRRLEAVYRERERFARDLHDDVIQSIYGVGLGLQITGNLISKDPPRAASQVASAVEGLNKVIHTLRAYIHDLEYKDGDMEGLLAGLVEQFREKTELDIKLDYRLPARGRIQPAVGTVNWQHQVQQIIREALHNITRHARASQALVELREEGERLVITIKDNGRGLPKGGVFQVEGGKHCGLRNMHTRAVLLGGELQLSSKAGEGTTLVLTIPLEKVER